MTTLATGLIGAAVGGIVGAPGIGFSVGTALGQAFLRGRSGSQSYTHQEGSRLSDLKVQTSQVGMMIPMVYGTYRIAGNLIWATDIVEHSSTTTQTQSLGGGGKGGGHHGDNTVTQTTTSYSYTANFALGLCQGEILGIRRLWADGKLIYNISGTATTQTLLGSQLRAKQIRLYQGTEDQLPDPLIEAYVGAGNVPAFRGLAYLVFEDFALAEFGNRLPNITVEVVQVGSHLRNVSPPKVQSDKPLSESMGEFCAFDGSVIHAKVKNNALHSPPERVDLDLNLNVIQRFKGTNLLPNQGYVPLIKGMPNLFVTQSPPYRWYDVTTGLHALIDPTLGKPQRGVYAHGHLYCAYKGEKLVRPTLVHYQMKCPFDFPTTVMHKIDYEKILHQALDHKDIEWVDIDIQHNYLFISALAQHTPYLLAFDPNSAKLIQTWVLKLDERHCLTPADQAALQFTLSLNSNSTQALLTQSENNQSRGFLVNIDVEADVLFPDPTDTYRFEGLGQFHFISDDIIYVSGTSPHGTSQAQIQGLHAIEPAAPLLSDVVEDLYLKVGLTPDSYEMSLLQSKQQTVAGFVLSQPTAVRESLRRLQQAYGFDLVESGFQLTCIPRGQSEVIKIDEGELAAEYGQTQTSSAGLLETRGETAELPQQINILFTDVEHAYQQGHQMAQRSHNITTTQQAQTIELPIALTNNQAANIAETLLHEAWMQRSQFEFTLSRKYAYLDPADHIEINDKRLRITSIAYGDPGLVNIKAVADNPTIYDALLLANDKAFTEEFSINCLVGKTAEVALSSPTQLYLFDIPILQDADDDTGFYITVSKLLPHWPGVVIAQSNDNGQTFKELYSQNKAATIGIAQNALSAGQMTVFDEESQLTVKLTQGELVSVNEMNLLNGANACLLGQEILQ